MANPRATREKDWQVAIIRHVPEEVREHSDADLTEAEVGVISAFAQTMIERGLLTLERQRSGGPFGVGFELSILARAMWINPGTKKHKQMEDLLEKTLGHLLIEDEPTEKPAPTEQSMPLSRRPSYELSRGHVYMLTNPSMPGQVKIGMTSRSLETRIKQLSQSTSIATPFVMVWSFPCHNPFEVEQAIHAELSSVRVSSREFFRVDVDTAVEVCQRVSAACGVPR